MSDVITRVRRTFGDEAAVQVQDADIIRWINDGQVEIVRDNDSAMQATGFVDLVANQQEYTLPTDLYILRSLRFKYADFTSFVSLKYLNIQQFDEMVDGWDGTFYGTAQPRIFTKYESKVALFPIPDQANTNGLKILYSKRPANVDDSADALTVPEIYHTAVVKFCLWQASLLDEDFEPSVMYQTNFKQDVDSLSNREVHDPSATYPTITVLAEDAW